MAMIAQCPGKLSTESKKSAVKVISQLEMPQIPAPQALFP
jgi:hypothetical protein